MVRMVVQQERCCFLFSDACFLPRANFACRLRAGKSTLLNPHSSPDFDSLSFSARHGGRYDPIRAQLKMKNVAEIIFQLASCSAPAGESGELSMEAEIIGKAGVVDVLKRSLERSARQS